MFINESAEQIPIYKSATSSTKSWHDGPDLTLHTIVSPWKRTKESCERDYHTANGGKRMAMTARRKSELVRVISECRMQSLL
jgi:hypothetical protein